MDKYKIELKSTASRLDKLTDFHGFIKKAVDEIVDEHNDKSTLELISVISTIVSSDNYTQTIRRIAINLRNYLIAYYGYEKIAEISIQQKEKLEEDSRSLQELLSELDRLIGLKKVKEKVNDLIAYQMIQKLRIEKKLLSAKSTLHLAFTGNPGTGKTTVARIVGRIYKQIGLLSKGHFIEVSRTDLIAGYQGQTALKVKSVIDRAKGGVLFIDEAYSITENDRSDAYGRECLTELTKALEDYRDDLVVIVAGYTEPMRKFFESNPGLKSRFNTFIEFEDYSADELGKILELMCIDNDYILSPQAKNELYTYFSSVLYENENFANGRTVRNLYEDLVMSHAKRVINIIAPSKQDLSTILADDFVACQKNKLS